MEKRKILGLLLSLTILLGAAKPGTLAVSADTEKTEDRITIDGTEKSAEASSPEETTEGTTVETEGTTEGTEASLFERLMGCTSLDELLAILDGAAEEDLQALTEEENAQVEAKITALEPEPLPAVVIEESADEPVISEIIYLTVNFDEVAPFGDPVVGGGEG